VNRDAAALVGRQREPARQTTTHTRHRRRRAHCTACTCSMQRRRRQRDCDTRDRQTATQRVQEHHSHSADVRQRQPRARRSIAHARRRGATTTQAGCIIDDARAHKDQRRAPSRVELERDVHQRRGRGWGSPCPARRRLLCTRVQREGRAQAV
jgi:hypothetical protein